MLVDKFSLKDHRFDDEIAALYQEKVEKYEEIERRQQEELKVYGYLKSFGGVKPKE